MTINNPRTPGTAHVSLEFAHFLQLWARSERFNSNATECKYALGGAKSIVSSGGPRAVVAEILEGHARSWPRTTMDHQSGLRRTRRREALRS